MAGVYPERQFGAVGHDFLYSVFTATNCAGFGGRRRVDAGGMPADVAGSILVAQARLKVRCGISGRG